MEKFRNHKHFFKSLMTIDHALEFGRNQQYTDFVFVIVIYAIVSFSQTLTCINLFMFN